MRLNYDSSDFSVSGGSLSLKSSGGLSQSEVIDLIYPVGSVYISMNTDDPEDLFPGTTWERFGGGRVLMGCGGSDSYVSGYSPESPGILYSEHQVDLDASGVRALINFDSDGKIWWAQGPMTNTSVRSFTASAEATNISYDWQTRTLTDAVNVVGTITTYQPSISAYFWRRTS